MTAQIKDRIKYQGKEYLLEDLILPPNRALHPPKLGIKLKFTSMNTACYSGIYCVYELSQDRGVILQDLYVLECDEYPELNGRKPVIEGSLMFPARYNDLNMFMGHFTGILYLKRRKGFYKKIAIANGMMDNFQNLLM